MRNNLKPLLLILTLAIIFFGLRYLTRPISAEEFIESIRKSTEPGLDSLNLRLQKEDYLRFRIDSLISQEDYAKVLNLLDTINIDPNVKLDYRGQIAFKKGKFKESLLYYNEAIAKSGIYFISVSHRAEVYVKMKLFDSGISDYKKLCFFNYDFYRPLAETFELANEKDSALKYYQMYFENYPDSISVKSKIAALKKGG